MILAKDSALVEWLEAAIVGFMEENGLREITIHVPSQSDISLPDSGRQDRIEGSAFEHQNRA